MSENGRRGSGPNRRPQSSKRSRGQGNRGQTSNQDQGGLDRQGNGFARRPQSGRRSRGRGRCRQTSNCQIPRLNDSIGSSDTDEENVFGNGSRHNEPNRPHAHFRGKGSGRGTRGDNSRGRLVNSRTVGRGAAAFNQGESSSDDVRNNRDKNRNRAGRSTLQSALSSSDLSGSGNKKSSNAGNKHWKQRFGFTKLTELKDKPSSDIVLEFSANDDLLKDVLDVEEHSNEMVELLLICISKACGYTALRQNVLNLLVLVESSQFFKMTILKLIAKIQSTIDSELEEYETSILCILKICKEIKSRIPNSMFQIIGISSMLGQVIVKLANCDRPITQELMLAYKTLIDSNDTTLGKITNEVKKPKRSLTVAEDNLQPPQNFRDIPVFPEMYDIHVDVFPFLRKNKIDGKYENLHHYLDVQFRLLREDFVGPLRDGIHDYIQSLHGAKDKGAKSKDIRVYREVQIIGPVCNTSGLCKRVSFSCPGFKRIRWESSKRLLFGSLVCLSADNFDTLIFATVANRDLKDLKKGLVDLKFENDSNTTEMTTENEIFIMAESSAFFEAYRHVLIGLKTMHDGDLPFERYIVACECDVEPPAYLRRTPRPRYDLRPLVDGTITIQDKTIIGSTVRQPVYMFSPESAPANNVNVISNRNWPSPKLLQLDESQFNAVQMALSKEFVIVQGPPGTGKTYIGLKIVKALLHNCDIWNPDDNRSPLLVVCYTNHALDQFLEGILSFYMGDVLRLGSRSSSDIMKQHNINTKRMALRRNRNAPLALFREKNKARVRMKTLKEAINKISQRIEAARRELLHEETLEAIIGQTLWNQLLYGYNLLVQEMRTHGFILPKGRKESALLEWLGYGNLTCGQTTLHLPTISTTADVLVENDPDDEDDEDEFIDAVDEVDEQMKQRMMDIFDDDELYEDIDDEGAVLEITKMLKTMGLTKDIVALDVSSLGTKQSADTNEWQIDPKQKKRIKKTLRRELSMLDKMNTRDVSRIQNIWKLEQNDRWRLYRYWVHCYCETLQQQIGAREEEFQEACDLVAEMQLHEDKEIMRRSTVIGLTTTCAARYQSVLREIGPKVIVVEEAAEVLEAHVITTLSSKCEHLILIGDHQQLKPNPTVYKLARHYNLEISLFERLIKNKLDYRCLSLQHRMRPEISKVMKIIYPQLKDHDIVKTYENIKGVSQNAFFINHSELESCDQDLKSHSNIHEAEYIVSLCRYLLLQGYKREQITVLTLYSAQLFELKQRMPKSDFNGVHLTVVDNYQGEENDIILLSLVRSNLKNNLGFVSIENRICVALSRARKGLFVIGNFGMLETEKKNDLWKSIVSLARKENMIGDSLLLYCQNHPEKKINAATANDFKNAPEGGCIQPCEYRLICGHFCTRACHVYDKEHTEFKCMKPCQKTVCQLNHKCRGICSKKCPKCKVPVPKTVPGCGHEQNIPCFQDASTWTCKGKCETTLLCGHPCQNTCGEKHTESCQYQVTKTWPCGHKDNIKCCQKDQRCPKPCKQILVCEHICGGTCGGCYYGRLHQSCKNKCRRSLVCEHLCKDRCSNCPPCSQRCQNRCVHSSCQTFCGEVCIPCTEPCEWECEHYTCKQLCSEPCKRPRCDAPCKKLLKCGHPCIGLCGEPCPQVCRSCNKETVQEIFFGTEDDGASRFVQLQDCLHFFEVSGLDKWMDDNNDSDEKKTSIKLKECPKCKTPIRRNLRYGNIVKHALKDIENVKKQKMGDKRRIQNLEVSIRKGIVELSLDDRTVVKQHMENMAKGPVSEHSFAMIENQIRFLSRLREITDSYDDAKTNVKSVMMIKNTGYYEDQKSIREFILQQRMFFTEQEVTDILDELERFKHLLQLLKFKLQKDKLKIDLGEQLSKDAVEVEICLTDNKKFSENRQKFVRKFLKQIEKLVPGTGLGITEKERLQIVKAMDLSKGHWYKCPNGHVYAIGECGGATVESVCPECKATIGGQSHRLREDNAVATEMDGATQPAWSEQAHIENYDPFEIRY